MSSSPHGTVTWRGSNRRESGQGAALVPQVRKHGHRRWHEGRSDARRFAFDKPQKSAWGRPQKAKHGHQCNAEQQQPLLSCVRSGLLCEVVQGLRIYRNAQWPWSVTQDLTMQNRPLGCGYCGNGLRVPCTLLVKGLDWRHQWLLRG